MYGMYRFCCHAKVGADPAQRSSSKSTDDIKTIEKRNAEVDNSSAAADSSDNKPVHRNKAKTAADEETRESSIQQNVDSSVVEAVDYCWKTVDVQRETELKRRKSNQSQNGAGQHRGWKTIRVFVSSTFTDMHSEREILIKKVFPALREWCEERKFMLIDCDLRWGVPKDSTTRTTILTCLEELDRCHEDNEELPFFINMLSERYGWIPTDKEVPDDVQLKYKWIPQISITHMEILHGAFRFDNPNALFCLRDPSFVKDLPSSHVPKFVDKEPLNQYHLKLHPTQLRGDVIEKLAFSSAVRNKVLKEKLSAKFPKQSFVYSCHVKGVDKSTGREKVNIAGLEPFGERILSFLKEAIERQYPGHQLAAELSLEEQENNAHLAAMQLRSSFVVGRDREVSSIVDFMKSGKVSTDFTDKCEDAEQIDETSQHDENDESKDDEEVKNENANEAEENEAEDDEGGETVVYTASFSVTDNMVGGDGYDNSIAEKCETFGVKETDARALAVVGNAGIGKSALLAAASSIVMQGGATVVYHQVGTSVDSLKPETIIRRLLAVYGAKTDTSKDNGEASGEQEFDPMEKMCEFLKLAAAQSKKKLVLVIDALDELDENDSASYLNWFPPRFPQNVQCVVSSRGTHRPCIARLEDRGMHFLRVDELTTDGATAIVNNYLSRFNKRLDPDQLASLLEHKSSRIPVWLGVTCEEMRVFGDFATITGKIRNFPDDLIELFKQVLDRLLQEDETQYLEKVLSIMYCCKVGLPEKFALKLLGNLETEEDAPMVAWATNRRYLKPYMRVIKTGSTSVITMANSQFQEALQQRVVSDSEKEIFWHKHLAEFYQKHCKDEWMVVENLPHHLLNGQLWQSLKDFYHFDERSLNASAYYRGYYLNQIRCQNFIQRNIPQMYHPIYVCMSCSMRGGLLSPSGLPTKDACAVCGAWSPQNFNQRTPAAVCQWHCTPGSPMMAQCWTCKRPVSVNNGPSNNSNQHLYLCFNCSLGVKAQTCCYLFDQP